MQATTGTNTAIWANYGIGLLIAAVQMINPTLLAAVLPPWLQPFVAPLILVLNGLVHARTGNSATSILPGVVAPSKPEVGAAGG